MDNVEFVKRMADKTIRRLLPLLFREILPLDAKCLEAAKRCEDEGSANAAAYAAYAAANANAANGYADKYLILSANLAIEVLAELQSPGVEWMERFYMSATATE